MAVKNPKPLGRKEKTLAELDLRLHDLMLNFLSADPDMSTDQFCAYLRAAYTQGYTDCLKEPTSTRGKWIKELGYGVSGVDL